MFTGHVCRMTQSHALGDASAPSFPFFTHGNSLRKNLGSRLLRTPCSCASFGGIDMSPRAVRIRAKDAQAKMWGSETLLDTPLFQSSALVSTDTAQLAQDSYLRAQAISAVHGLRVRDVGRLADSFWSMHTDPILAIDGAAATVLTIHHNLCIGSLAAFLFKRPDIRPVVASLRNYDTIGQFCLTEVGHGLDAFNLGTTATLQPDGCFELHTPTPENSKYMPPTLPVLGKPCIAVVFAQLVVEKECRGIRPFLVHLNDGHKMTPGITAKLLPVRHGSAPVNHAITSFDRIRLPGSALLGPLASSNSPRADFLASIWRVGVGTLALSAVAIPALQIASTVAYRYSVRRRVRDHNGEPVPIISFQTQRLPVYTAVAQAHVFRAFYKHAVRQFMEQKDHRVKHGIATAFKAVVLQQSIASHFALSERCGAQGLFGCNQIVTQLSELRGISIAEGDTLVLCIRLANELFLERYALPAAKDESSLLAKHEGGIFRECRAVIAEYGHRSAEANALLPRCAAAVEAIGHRLAFEAAVAEGVPKPLISLYVLHALKADLAWYVEAGLLNRKAVVEMERDALSLGPACMEKWVEDMNVGPYIRAPIVDDTAWTGFTSSLPVVGEVPSLVGDAPVPADLIFPAPKKTEAGRVERHGPCARSRTSSLVLVSVVLNRVSKLLARIISNIL